MYNRVEAHEAPTGWTYPTSCCSNKDCREVPHTEIIETPNGYLISTTNELIPYDDKRIRESPDGLHHRCARSNNFTPDGETLCIFVPPSLF
jgi:hypothetical protein